MAEIKFPVIARMRNCFGNYLRWLDSFDIHSWTSPEGLNLVVSASVKYWRLEKDALGHITKPESKLFGGLLLAYGVLCLECRNAFSISL